MSDSSDPIETIKSWQEWYKKHPVVQEWYKKHPIVAELDEPMASKDSREGLHDTSKATDAIPNWREHYAELIGDRIPLQGNNLYKEKATEYFADIIAEFIGEMSAQELFDCFATAAKQNLDFTTKEYDQAKDLMDLIQGKHYGQK